MPKKEETTCQPIQQSMECEPISMSKFLSSERIENVCLSQETVKKISEEKQVYESNFTQVTFAGFVRGSAFVDVLFDRCDFSNAVFQECSFRRVVFRKCRCTGMDLSGSSLQDVFFDNCLINLGNLNAISWKRCLWKTCSFCEASFSMDTFAHCTIQDCDLTKTEWNQTSLKGLDLSDSQIDGIAVSAKGLEGVTLSSSQAIACAQLWGIHVK